MCVGSEKRHLTVVFTCTADGVFLPPMMIFKGKTNRTIDKLTVRNDFVVATQTKSWMDDALMLRYIDEIWMPYIKKTGCLESILCFDTFKAHISASSEAKLRTKKVHASVISGGCTSILQPLDVCLNKPFNSLLRHSWQNYMLSETEKLDKENPKGKIPPPSRQLIVDWVEDTWANIKRRKDSIAKSFLVTDISNTFGTWEEELITNDDLRKEIDKQLTAVFGSTQLTSVGRTDDDLIEDVSSDSDSSDSEACHNDVLVFSNCSESSVAAGEWSDIDSDCEFSA